MSIPYMFPIVGVLWGDSCISWLRKRDAWYIHWVRENLNCWQHHEQKQLHTTQTPHLQQKVFLHSNHVPGLGRMWNCVKTNMCQTKVAFLKHHWWSVHHRSPGQRISFLSSEQTSYSHAWHSNHCQCFLELKAGSTGRPFWWNQRSLLDLHWSILYRMSPCELQHGSIRCPTTSHNRGKIDQPF